MSFNMQHQAVSLSQSEKYTVETKLERQEALDLGARTCMYSCVMC